MIEFLIGVDGGGSGTRVRLARTDGVELAEGVSGPYGLLHGIANAWAAVEGRHRHGLPRRRTGIPSARPDRHRPRPGRCAQQAVGGRIRRRQSRLRPRGAGDRRPHHGAGRATAASPAPSSRSAPAASARSSAPTAATSKSAAGASPPATKPAAPGWDCARSTISSKCSTAACPAAPSPTTWPTPAEGERNAIQNWLAKATQTNYGQLARIVLQHGESNEAARLILLEAGREVEIMANALDTTGTLPIALCGGLARAATPVHAGGRC